MSDIVEQGKSMLSTIEYTKAKGITQAYPDSSVAEVLGKLVAEVERLRRDLGWRDSQIADRERRDGECLCDHNPSTTDGPQEDCPYHGRAYGYWVEGVAQLQAVIERVRALALNPVQIVDGSRRVGPCVIPREILDALEASR